MAEQISPGYDTISKEEWEAGATWRYALRQFLSASEQAARRVGVTAQQYQLLQTLKGYPGRDYATGTELAERMKIRRHSMVGLINRCEALELVRREADTQDHRRVYIHLTPKGEEIVYRLATSYRQELVTLFDVLQALPIWIQAKAKDQLTSSG